jgi:hypothetical protein
MFKLKLPVLLLLFSTILWSCEMNDEEIQHEVNQKSVPCPGLESSRKADNNVLNETCETAFTNGDVVCGWPAEQVKCFVEDDFNRWGWTSQFINSFTLSHDSEWISYKIAIIAAAGQCDPDKGVIVGEVELLKRLGWDFFRVTYNLYDDFLLSEVHFYIGETPYPMFKGKETVAPGKYTYIAENLNQNDYQFEISSGDSDYVWVIAHAIVCKVNQ